MPRILPLQRFTTAAAAFSLCVLFATLGGCASRPYAPGSAEAVGLSERAEVQSMHGVTVHAAVPSEAETETIFGLPLYERGIQPIWIQVHNDTDHRLRYAPVGTDDQYFPAHEVAYMHKGRYKGDGYLAMEKHLHAHTMPRWIWPSETRSGWVFTHIAPGTKAFNVDLFQGAGEDVAFSFFIDVPGRSPDHAAIDFATLYEEAATQQLDVDSLRAALADLGCCTTDVTGREPGRPFSISIVGDGPDVLMALLRADFFERPRAERPEDIDLEPHYQGRPPDAVFRTRRSGLGDRNELRVWLAPMRVGAKPVWVGQLTHYIGSPTEVGRAFFDDRIDPNVSDGRDFMLQTMWYSQSLEAFAWQRVLDPLAVDAPRRDFRGIEYFWDGVRVVLWLSGDPVSQGETVNFLWDSPPMIGERR